MSSLHGRNILGSWITTGRGTYKDFGKFTSEGDIDDVVGPTLRYRQLDVLCPVDELSIGFG